MGDFIPREKILAGGASGSSKTYSFLTIVQALSGGHHFAIEVDDGFIKVLKNEFADIQATAYEWSNGQWAVMYQVGQGDQLRVYHCNSFSEVRKAQMQLEKMLAEKIMGRGDWVSLDGLDLIYNTMRYEFIQRAVPAKTERRGKVDAAEDAWEAALNIKETGAPMLDPGDWDTINNFYEGLLNYVMFQIPCNAFCTCGLTTFDDKSSVQSDDVKEFYKNLGTPLKFEGQKRTARAFDTLLAFTHDTSGYYIYIWKDRGGKGRPLAQEKRHTIMSQYTNGNFYIDIGVAKLGWTPV